MARPQKLGLTYFPLDTTFLSSTEIRLLRARHGADGVLIYLSLVSQVYADHGYYTLWHGDDSIKLLALDFGLKDGTVRQVVGYLCSLSLLERINTSIRDVQVTAITSAGIQRRWQAAKTDAGRKTPIRVDSRFWVLDPEETEPFIKVCHFEDSSGNNSGFSGNDSGFSGKNSVNKSKEKESKEERRNNQSTTVDQSSPSAIGARESHLRDIILSRLEESVIPSFLGYIADLDAREAMPVADKRVKAYITRLLGLTADPAMMVRILDQSTRKHWKGLFPVKEDQPRHPGGSFANFEQRPTQEIEKYAEELMAQQQRQFDAEQDAWKAEVSRIFHACDDAPDEIDAIDWDRTRASREIVYRDGRRMSADQWHRFRGSAQILELKLS